MHSPLAYTEDITATVLVFPNEDDSYNVLCRFFIPEEGMRRRVKRDRVPYDTWVQSGFMQTTGGSVTDYAAVRHQMDLDGQKFDIREVAIDRYNYQKLVAELADDGHEVMGFGQGFKSMAGPTSELLRLILDGKINHGGNPILRWMASNVAVEMNSAGDLKPCKKKSYERIDGITALVMGVGRAIVQPESPASVYETRGILTL